MGFIVQKDWTTKAGFRAVIVLPDIGHHCGYVGIPPSHPLHGKNYGDVCDCLVFPSDESMGKRGVIPIFCSNGEATPDAVFDVHGGINFSGGDSDYPAKSTDLWWFGYDCGHSGDGRSESYLKTMEERYPNQPFMWTDRGVFRDVDYCISECESLAQQLVDRVSVERVDSKPDGYEELMAQRDELLEALKEARRWIGDGDMSDGMAREIWTPKYAAAVDMVDAAISSAEKGGA